MTGPPTSGNATCSVCKLAITLVVFNPQNMVWLSNIALKRTRFCPGTENLHVPTLS